MEHIEAPLRRYHDILKPVLPLALEFALCLCGLRYWIDHKGPWYFGGGHKLEWRHKSLPVRLLVVRKLERVRIQVPVGIVVSYMHT